MANNNMDNYIDSLEDGTVIEYEGNEFIVRYIEGEYIVCEFDYIKVSDFYDDLEFGENHKFNQWIAEQKEDEQKEAGILYSKGE